MPTSNQTVSKGALWTGRTVSGLIAVFMTFDAVVKIIRIPAAVEGTSKLGYSPNVLVPLGLVALACVALYIIPRTSALGAVLLTGYLGGATATKVRMSDPWFVLPVLLGVLAWLGLYLRDAGLRSMLPLRN